MYILPFLILLKIQSIALVSVMVIVLKVLLFYLVDFSIPSLIQVFSQNVGLVKLSGIRTRLPIYYAAGFLILLGLLPKFGALAQIIPSPVLGGAMLVMFGFCFSTRNANLVSCGL